MIRLQQPLSAARSAHPWVTADHIEPSTEPAASTQLLVAPDGETLGSGIYDRRDPRAAWRRISWADGVEFDENYVAQSLQEAFNRRPDEPCLRLVSSDADYLPGLVIEQFYDLITIRSETAAVDAHLSFIAEVVKESFKPQEIVLINDAPQRQAFGLDCYRRTLSGNNLKGRWVEIDELAYRLDPLNPSKAGFFLDQREQQALVGSLCEGRSVLDGFAHSGGFAMQAVRSGAELAVAVEADETYAKGLAATIQKNALPVEVLHTRLETVLERSTAGSFDAIILDPPATADYSADSLAALHEQAFQLLPTGGLLATYCRDVHLGAAEFDQLVANAAAKSGREGRIFARISQPFDFPVLLNLPESRRLKGLILQVE